MFEIFFWILHLYCLRDFFPEVLNYLPATGGDTASHLWPVIVLRNYGLPNFTLHPYNPANFTGEPLLLHYFPLPFLLMAVASYFMPVGLAFNLGTFLPVFFLPPAAAWMTKELQLGLGSTRRVARLSGAFAGVFSLGVLYNYGNTMWGGNFYSVLAGQFCHQYAFVFFFLFIGCLPSALSAQKTWLFASLLFCCVVISHAYVALFLPVALLGILISCRNGSVKRRLVRLCQITLCGSLLSVWFWWPLIDNAKWTTPYGLKWLFTDWFHEVVPQPIALSTGSLVVSAALGTFFARVWRVQMRAVLFWFPQILFGILGYFLFSKFGLVDVRTIPHVQYVLVILSAMVLAAFVAETPRPVSLALFVLLIGLPVLQYKLVQPELERLKNWVHWNYSSWASKEGYRSLEALSRDIAGNFDDPRVAFEHSELSNMAGTPRVFEMLPYFANRSVTDGVYMQSTILAPMCFYHQALISKAPSCPFPNYPCSRIDLDKGIRLGELLGVGTYIFQSDEMIHAADANPRLKSRLFARPWHVYDVVGARPSNVVIVRGKPEWVDRASWRNRFWNWFENYTGEEPTLVNNWFGADDKEPLPVAGPGEKCNPSITSNYSVLSLKTDCPGKLHVIRYAFHSAWKADSGDPTYLVSPGFIGIVPSRTLIHLTFGNTWSWSMAEIFSVLTMAFMISIFAKGAGKFAP